jgi:hypothetical protein
LESISDSIQFHVVPGWMVTMVIEYSDNEVFSGPAAWLEGLQSGHATTDLASAATVAQARKVFPENGFRTMKRFTVRVAAITWWAHCEIDVTPLVNSDAVKALR